MRKTLRLLLIFNLLFLHTSCKEEEDDLKKDGPTTITFDFYLVNKETRENLVGVGKEFPYSPGEVDLFVMYNNDPSTKRNFVNNYFFREDDEIGYFYRFDYGFEQKADYLIYLGELKQDTVTILNMEKNGFELYVNSVLEEQFTFDEYINDIQIPRYRIEKEL